MGRIKVWFVDREWWDPDRKEIVGDMGFSFGESPDTLTRDFDALQLDMEQWIACGDAEDEKGTWATGFAIYVVYSAVIERDDYCSYLSMNDVVLGSIRKEQIYALSTEEGAYGCDLEGWYGKKKVKYL